MPNKNMLLIAAAAVLLLAKTKGAEAAPEATGAVDIEKVIIPYSAADLATEGISQIVFYSPVELDVGADLHTWYNVETGAYGAGYHEPDGSGWISMSQAKKQGYI